MAKERLRIGELAAQAGLSAQAIRFYESRGLVRAMRTTGNQRRFLRADIRRLSFALIAQQLGLTLGDHHLPPGPRRGSSTVHVQ